MPYRKVVFIKLFLRLFEEDDRFLYQLNESQQLLYLKMLVLAGITGNKIPKNFRFIQNKINYAHDEQCFNADIKRIMEVFPHVRADDFCYYIDNFWELHNWYEEEGVPKEFLGSSKGVPKEFPENSKGSSQNKNKNKNKEKEKEKEEEKEREIYKEKEKEANSPNGSFGTSPSLSFLINLLESQNKEFFRAYPNQLKQYVFQMENALKNGWTAAEIEKEIYRNAGKINSVKPWEWLKGGMGKWTRLALQHNSVS